MFSRHRRHADLRGRRMRLRPVPIRGAAYTSPQATLEFDRIPAGRRDPDSGNSRRFTT